MVNAINMSKCNKIPMVNLVDIINMGDNKGVPVVNKINMVHDNKVSVVNIVNIIILAICKDNMVKMVNIININGNMVPMVKTKKQTTPNPLILMTITNYYKPESL